MGTTSTKVLFVSSHKSLMEDFTNFKACRDWDKDTCSDSFSAIQHLRSSSYDVVVMDYEIGPLNPYKLMDYVFHELKKQYPMVIVGGDGDQKEVRETYLRINYPIEQEDIDEIEVFMSKERKSPKKEQLFSLDYLNELSDNNQEFLEESIVLFRDSLNLKFKDLKKSISESKFEEARQIAHNVKPTFAMMGNDKGRSICHTICYDAKDHEIPGLSRMLENEYILISNEIEKQFPKLKML